MSNVVETSHLSTISDEARERLAVEDYPTEGTELVHALEVQAGYSDTELLTLLQDKKASARDPRACIKEVQATADLHPIPILTALGFDLTRQLGDCYCFFSRSRYPIDQAVFTRDRSTRDGLHCWSQGGGKLPITDGSKLPPEGLIIGYKRKFTFMEKPLKKKRSHMMVGPKYYSFRLEELVTADDEEQEKITSSEKQTPKCFMCVYRLFPVLQSKGSSRYLQRFSYTLTEPNAAPHGQSSSLILNRPASEALPTASYLQSAPEFPLVVELAQEGKVSQEPAEDIEDSPVLPKSHRKCRYESSSEVQANDLNCEMNNSDLSGFPEGAILHDPEEWNSPQLIHIPALEERYDRAWMGPVKRN